MGFVLAGIGLAQVVPPAMPVLGTDVAPGDLSLLIIYTFFFFWSSKNIFEYLQMLLIHITFKNNFLKLVFYIQLMLFQKSYA